MALRSRSPVAGATPTAQLRARAGPRRRTCSPLHEQHERRSHGLERGSTRRSSTLTSLSGTSVGISSRPVVPECAGRYPEGALGTWRARRGEANGLTAGNIDALVRAACGSPGRSSQVDDVPLTFADTPGSDPTAPLSGPHTCHVRCGGCRMCPLRAADSS